MRIPEYLSPTSIALADKDMEAYYVRYLSDNKPPRDPQTQPMSIGSAFDAYVKSFLYERLIGKNPEYELRTLFESQVQSHNRDWAWVHGEHCFNLYRESGALADLLIELNQAISEPVFEIKLEGVLQLNPESPPVNFLGKPDIYYINETGTPIIIDWKVNGWCSNSPISPKRGYMKLLHGSNDRSLDKQHHRDCFPMKVNGMMINAGLKLNDIEKKWAAQTSIYAWLCGAPIGSDFIAGIDQVVCKPVGRRFPEVKFAKHRLQVEKAFQLDLYSKAATLWETIHSDHILKDRSKSESQARCSALDVAFDDPMFNEITKGNSWF
jgi:hypothetical protein